MVHVKLNWRIIPLTEIHAQELCEWRYPAPYDVYNWPSWTHMQREQLEFADPQICAEQYQAVVDERDRLCGFMQLFPLVGVTRLGLGLRPDLCGRGGGIGAAFVRLLVQEAQRLHPEQEIDLEVLVWNERAIRTYRQAGFTITDTYEKWTPTGAADFHCMVFEGG